MVDEVGLDLSWVRRLDRGAHSWDLHNFPLVVLPKKCEKWQL